MAFFGLYSLPATRYSSGTTAPLAWLDFGCGAGGFLKFLRERSKIAGRPLVLTGHDVGSYAELLKTTDGFRVLDFDEINREPSAQFDVISLIEVIEHIPEPASTIALVSRLLKPGGLLLLTTGNLDSRTTDEVLIREAQVRSDNVVTALDGEPALDPREVLPIRADQRGSGAVVVEGDDDLGFVRGLNVVLAAGGECRRIRCAFGQGFQAPVVMADGEALAGWERDKACGV